MVRKLREDRKTPEEARVAGAHVVFYKMTRTRPDNKGDQYVVRTVLLVKRTLDAPIHPGLWGLPGGMTSHKDRNSEATAKREVKEELCVKGGLLLESLKHMHCLCIVRVLRHEEPLYIQYFKAPLGAEMDGLALRRNKQDDKVEGEGVGWFSEEEVGHMFVSPEDREALNTFFSQIH